jgi:hypothetical protein
MIQLRALAVALICAALFAGARQPATPQPLGSKVWVGRYQELEDYLRTAECLKMDVMPSYNSARCTFRPGGPVARMIWRALPPGVYRGFHESYRSEIAAYELDKLLNIDMVPPTVERQLEGHSGAAQLWVENITDMQKDELPDDGRKANWDSQLARMVMFDDLIGNRDRNRGNMLRDSIWNLILIDHSRSFGNDTDISSKLTRIDADLWARIESLTPALLDTTLGPWVPDAGRKAILERRDKLRVEVRRLQR